jgi:tetratricopeptide (TPR) repeat protein
MYGLTKQDKQAMFMTDAAYVGGAIEQSSELLNLAYMFMGEGYYYRAAKIMEAGLKEKQIEGSTKNLQTLAQAWQLSQETDKAIAVMLEAAEKTDGGDVWAKLASSYIDDFQNQKAIDAGRKALDKGGVERVDQLHIVMGMAYANLNRWDSCIKSFDNAAKDNRSKKFAGNWKKFCTSEKEREEALAAG